MELDGIASEMECFQGLTVPHYVQTNIKSLSKVQGYWLVPVSNINSGLGRDRLSYV